MTQQQNDNIALITASLTKFGITNPNLQAGILATISKESDFIPQRENLNYTAADITRVWPNTPASDIPGITNNPVALGNYKYGGKGGNASDEGYLYRGGGFNQITFKDEYQQIGDQIGVDLVSNPDLIDDPQTASDAAAAFFSNELTAGINAGSFTKFGVTNVSDITDTTKGTQVAVQINAGRGTNFNNGVVQEGFNKAMDVVDSLLGIVLNQQPVVLQQTAAFIKKNWVPITITVTVTLIVIVALIGSLTAPKKPVLTK